MIRKSLATALLALPVSACSLFQIPVQQTVVQEQTLPNEWQGERLGGSTVNSLLDLIDDDSLEDFVSLALVANPNLQQTALRFEESEFAFIQTDADRWPTVSADIGSQRLKTTAGGDNYLTDYRASFDLGWEVDLWGRLSDGTRAAQADVTAAADDLESARNSLAAQVMQSWVELASLRLIIVTENARVLSLSNTEKTIAERYQAGIGEIADLDAARSATANAEAGLVARQDQYQQAIRALNTLLGQFPEESLVLPQTLPEVSVPLVSLPAEWVGNRPDLKSAYQRILAADARTAQAYKALLPRFSISASVTDNQSSVSDLLRESPAWNLLGNVTTPVFNAGRLRAQADSQATAAERAWWNYQQTLLAAMREVEDALDGERKLAEQQEKLEIATKYAEATLTHFQERYSEGLSDIINLLQVQRSVFDARVQLLETQRRRLNNRITLGLALGIGV